MRTAALLACALLSTPALAQTAATPTPEPGPIAMARPETRSPATLRVRSSAFPDGGVIPARYSRYYANISPPLRWSRAPSRTLAYALIVDDPDGRLKPVTHWTAWNLQATALPEGVPNGPTVAQPSGRHRLSPVAAAQGTTTMKTTGYAGPHPPLGDPPHHYHFQLFALDAPLGLAPGATRDALLAAMQGHVLAKGETVGLYAQATAPAP